MNETTATNEDLKKEYMRKKWLQEGIARAYFRNPARIRRILKYGQPTKFDEASRRGRLDNSCTGGYY